MDSRNAWRAHRGPWRVHHLLLSGRNRNEPSFDLESTLYSGREINAVYNNAALPLPTPRTVLPASASGASCDAPAYACYAQAFLRVWDPNVQPAIADQWNLTIQHQFWNDTTFQVGYVGQKGTHLMVPFDYAQRVLLPIPLARLHRVPLLAPSLPQNPTLYTVLGNPLRAARAPQFGHTIERHDGVQLIAGCTAEADDPRSAIPGVLHLLQVHVRQHRLLRSLEQRPQRLGLLAERVRLQRSEWAPCYYDATHVLSAYAIYELPLAEARSSAGRQ